MTQEIMMSVESDDPVSLRIAEESPLAMQTTEFVKGGGGTSDYNALSNKPSINGVTLSGDKTASDLSLATEAEVTAKYTKPADGIPGEDIASKAITGAKIGDNAVTASKISAGTITKAKLTAAVQATLDKADAALPANLGAENAGKFLTVGIDGGIEPVAMSAWQGGSF